MKIYGFLPRYVVLKRDLMIELLNQLFGYFYQQLFLFVLFDMFQFLHKQVRQRLQESSTDFYSS